jgi:hypothetical protein
MTNQEAQKLVWVDVATDGATASYQPPVFETSLWTIMPKEFAPIFDDELAVLTGDRGIAMRHRLKVSTRDYRGQFDPQGAVKALLETAAELGYAKASKSDRPNRIPPNEPSDYHAQRESAVEEPKGSKGLIKAKVVGTNAVLAIFQPPLSADRLKQASEIGLEASKRAEDETGIRSAVFPVKVRASDTIDNLDLLALDSDYELQIVTTESERASAFNK